MISNQIWGENVEYNFFLKIQFKFRYESDLVIGSVYVVGKKLQGITKDMLSSMNPGTVMVDVSRSGDVLRRANQLHMIVLHF